MVKHPVRDKIDIDQPHYSRTVFRIIESVKTECHINLWLPVILDNGGWVCPIQILGLDIQEISAMPGADPMDAFVRGMYFVRTVFEWAEGDFIFRNLDYGGFPQMEFQIAPSEIHLE